MSAPRWWRFRKGMARFKQLRADAAVGQEDAPFPSPSIAGLPSRNHALFQLDAVIATGPIAGRARFQLDDDLLVGALQRDTVVTAGAIAH